MDDHRQIYCVRQGPLIVGFEYPEQADDYARELDTHYEPVRLYMSGKKPKTWTVYTAEAAIWLDGGGLHNGLGPEEPSFSEYNTSELEGTPHEQEPCVMVTEEYDDRRWCRVIGTDEDLVRQRIHEWTIAEQAVRS